MYGMVHKAARAYAVERFGEPFWLTFSEELGLSDETFVMGESYADALTFSIIDGLARATATSRAQFLQEFGRYWIEFACRGDYANLMALSGATLPAFLANLDRLHSGLNVAMPGARMPSFELVDQTLEGVKVRYVSHRQGLEPFVAGLLEGLCALFEVQGDVTSCPDEPGALFDIRYRLPAAA